MKFLYIMRGLPGSGKSTVAKQLAGDIGVIHSSDEYFYENGVYKFDINKLPEVRQKNFEAFLQSVKNEIPIIVCDRCHIKHEEYEPFAKAAADAGYIVSIVTLPRPSLEVSIKRNIHNVPEESIRSMMERWEN